MVKREIYIRADGNPQIGLGHLIRCFALAKMLYSHFKIIFVCKEAPDLLSSDLNEEMKILEIKEESEFFAVLNKNSIVVLDGYDFSEDYYIKLKKFNYKTVSIQDFNRYSNNIDLVINHLPGTEKFYPNVQSLCGPKYAIIRKEFLSCVASEKETQHHYFISLGGTKNAVLVNKLVDLINQLDDKTEKINILTTNENKAEIKGSNIYFHSNTGAKDIIELIDKSSLCFITSGMVAYEVLARGKLAVVGALNSSQHQIGVEFAVSGLIQYVGYWEKVTKPILRYALGVQNIDREKIHSVFDGNSGKRILNKFLQL